MKKISNKKGKKLNKLIFKLLLIIFLSFSIYYQIFFYNKMNMIISDSFRKVNIKTDSSIKVGVCTLCKEENLYIQEFIDY